MKIVSNFIYFLVIFIISFPFCKAMEEGDMWEKTMKVGDREKMEEIIQSTNDNMERLRKIAKELPHIANAIIKDNKYELSRFENYSIGIPADEYLNLEDTLYAEHRRLLTESYYLENFLGEAFEENIQKFPFVD